MNVHHVVGPQRINGRGPSGLSMWNTLGQWGGRDVLFMFIHVAHIVDAAQHTAGVVGDTFTFIDVAHTDRNAHLLLQ